MNLRQKADRIAAESKAKRESEQNGKQEFIDTLNREIQARLDAKERERQATADAEAKAHEAAAERDVKDRVRARFPGIADGDFERLYPELRDRLLTEEADARGRRRHEVYGKF